MASFLLVWENTLGNEGATRLARSSLLWNSFILSRLCIKPCFVCLVSRISGGRRGYPIEIALARHRTCHHRHCYRAVSNMIPHSGYTDRISPEYIMGREETDDVPTRCYWRSIRPHFPPLFLPSSSQPLLPPPFPSLLFLLIPALFSSSFSHLSILLSSLISWTTTHSQ